jgi:hypothetical protein
VGGAGIALVLNGALAPDAQLGSPDGLFDAMASLPPSTSAQIAEAAGLSERYVRDWLGAMTTGGIVDHDPDQLTFVLPPHHAGWLTRAAGPANLAIQAQYVGLLALVRIRSSSASVTAAACPTPRTRSSTPSWPKTAAPYMTLL